MITRKAQQAERVKQEAKASVPAQDEQDILPGETIEEWDRRMDAAERSPQDASRLPLKYSEFYDPHMGDN